MVIYLNTEIDRCKFETESYILLLTIEKIGGFSGSSHKSFKK